MWVFIFTPGFLRVFPLAHNVLNPPSAQGRLGLERAVMSLFVRVFLLTATKMNMTLYILYYYSGFTPDSNPIPTYWVLQD